MAYILANNKENITALYYWHYEANSYQRIPLTKGQ